MLDKKILKLKHHFGCLAPEDWQQVSPEEILSLDGIGRVTLDHIRIYLAARNLALKNDRTPEYWQQNLAAARIGHQMGLDDEADAQHVTPFTILIDTAEQQPFAFQGLRGDQKDDARPWIVRTEWRALGRHPDSLGDYSLDGHVGRVHVERKSIEDCIGTILGFDGRRERFETELHNLSRIDAPLVVIEGTLQTVLDAVEDTTKKTAALRKKGLFRSILAFQQDYRIPWLFCDGRRLAEIATFRFLERYHNTHAKRRKQAEQLVAAL